MDLDPGSSDPSARSFNTLLGVLAFLDKGSTYIANSTGDSIQYQVGVLKTQKRSHKGEKPLKSTKYKSKMWQELLRLKQITRKLQLMQITGHTYRGRKHFVTSNY